MFSLTKAVKYIDAMTAIFVLDIVPGVALIQNILVLNPGIESVKPAYASSTNVSANKVFVLLKW